MDAKTTADIFLIFLMSLFNILMAYNMIASTNKLN